ncbi:hypothetical protein CPLU01_01595 [Colletotrichum plurivorum]|uniref:Uncharacterized protein n=1 Tax=Colletotrichum plurivorum TaxID=2175906 RepID=A0A8H6KYW4_9PEZI|nr:hypothetical protein CPLU01_01595 [Colletotrichum plurivorum]
MSLPPGVINLTAGGPPPPPPPHPARAQVPHAKQAGPPFFQVRGPALAAKPGPFPTGPPVGKQPMMRPPATPAVAHQGVQMVTQQMPIPQQMPVPPPRDMIPPELRQTRFVEFSDLRSERMTEAEAREALSEYVVYRFEKVVDPNETDPEGYPVRPTWENVKRVEVRDLSRRDIIRSIRELNAEGRTALQKKTDLTPSQQLQIETAQDALEARNLDKRFHYTLQQISHKLRKLPKDSFQYQQYMAERESKKLIVAKGKSAGSKERKSKKNLFETVSLIVYFKREPRLEENALSMYHSKQNEVAMGQRRDMEARQQQVQLQMQEQRQQHEFALFQQDQIHQARLRPPMPPTQPQGPPAPKPGVPPGLPGPPKGGKENKANGAKAPKPMIQVVHRDHEKGKVKVYPLSSSSSRSSKYSDNSDASWSENEFTPESSVTGSSDSNRHGRRHYRSRGRSRSRSRSHSRSRSRRRDRYHDRPEEYGLNAPRRHLKYDHNQLYILDQDLPRGRLVAAPMSPAAPPMLPRTRDFVEETVMPRRITSRPEPYPLEDVDDTLTGIFGRRRSALPARVIQRDVGFRPVVPREVARMRHEDDLDNIRRLRLEDEVRFEDSRRYEEELAAEREEIEMRTRRQMEQRFRRPSLDRGGLFQRVPAETYEEEAARDYMRLRERPARSLFDNPFDSLGRGTRRNSFGPAGYRD